MTTVQQVVTNTPYVNLWSPMQQHVMLQELSCPTGGITQFVVSTSVGHDDGVMVLVVIN